MSLKEASFFFNVQIRCDSLHFRVENEERINGSHREISSLLKEYLSNPKQNVGRNMGNKGHSDEVSEENEEPVIEHGGKVIHVIKQGGKKNKLGSIVFMS